MAQNPYHRLLTIHRQGTRMLRFVTFVIALALSGVSMAAAETANTGGGIVTVEMQTSHGLIVLELDAEKAPATVENFLKYVNSGFYDGTIFHRVIRGFMIQGGGFEPGMSQKKTDAPIRNEADNGLSNVKGTIAMARTPNPDSATSQFFINVADNQRLDHSSPTPQGWGYCVFGHVVKGMDVVASIESAPTTSRSGHRDVPAEDIVITKVTVSGEE